MLLDELLFAKLNLALRDLADSSIQPQRSLDGCIIDGILISQTNKSEPNEEAYLRLNRKIEALGDKINRQMRKLGLEKTLAASNCLTCIANIKKEINSITYQEKECPSHMLNL